MYVKTDQPGIIKDTHNGALLSIDEAGLAQRKKAIARHNEIEDMKTRMSNCERLLELILDKLG